ncbi:thiamine-binding protein [Mumia zhuanghuii]|nr:thiamine-binding protein [Mumia zhuanghuii]
MIAAFSISPATADEVVRASGLPHETHAMFTDVEGAWLHGDMTKGAA